MNPTTPLVTRLWYLSAGWGWVRCVREVRAAAAEWLGAAETSEVVLVPSTSFACDTLADGLAASGYLRTGDVVLSTDQEHPGGEGKTKNRPDSIVFAVSLTRQGPIPQPAG